MSGITQVFASSGDTSRVFINKTISTNTTNYALNVNNEPTYVTGKTTITITVQTGVYVRSTVTGGNNAAISVTKGGGLLDPADTVIIINKGYILGKGGNAGVVGPNFILGEASGQQGGFAIYTTSRLVVNNTDPQAYIGGGGSGGTACFREINISGTNYMFAAGGGGAAGGGSGGSVIINLSGTSAAGGAGSTTPGGSGGNGSQNASASPLSRFAGGGGGGLVILSGTGGASVSGFSSIAAGGLGGGTGGSGAIAYASVNGAASSGAGGSGSSVGGNPSGNTGIYYVAGGGGGGWGAAAGRGIAVTPTGDTIILGTVAGTAIGSFYGTTIVAGDTARIYGAIA